MIKNQELINWIDSAFLCLPESYLYYNCYAFAVLSISAYENYENEIILEFRIKDRNLSTNSTWFPCLKTGRRGRLKLCKKVCNQIFIFGDTEKTYIYDYKEFEIYVKEKIIQDYTITSFMGGEKGVETIRGQMFVSEKEPQLTRFQMMDLD